MDDGHHTPARTLHGYGGWWKIGQWGPKARRWPPRVGKRPRSHVSPERMHHIHDTAEQAGKVRLDKWLWAARFYKTRSLACEQIEKGRVQVNGQAAKPAREVRIGDEITLRTDYDLRTVIVRGLSAVRGPAPVAAQLYEETEASRRAREASAEQRRLAPEPAAFIRQGRPSKKDRRELDTVRGRAAWNNRWSASLED